MKYTAPGIVKSSGMSGRLLADWISIVSRWPVFVIMMAAMSTAGLHYYTVNNLGINTDTADMLSAKLPFRQTYEAYKREFPQYVDTLLLVIDADIPEQAGAAADALADRLTRMPQLFKSVYPPGGDRFYVTHGLLYLDVEELGELTDQLAQVQPFLGELASDPSLRGLLVMLGSAIDALEDGEEVDLDPVFLRMNKAIDAQLMQRDYQVSWQEFRSLGGLCHPPVSTLSGTDHAGHCA